MTNQKSLSPAKLAAIQKAQISAKNRMEKENTNPRSLGEKRAITALRTVYLWGWSTPTLLELSVGSARSGIGNRLVKNGLLAKTETHSGGINSTPAYILTLTKNGLDTISSTVGENYPYELHHEKINLRNMVHDELMQRLTLVFLANSKISAYETPKMLAFKNELDDKNPDALWINPSKKTAIELELTPKWGMEFDRLILKTLQLLSDGSYCASLMFLFKSKSALERYKEAFAPNMSFTLWKKEKGKTGRWLNVGRKTVTTEESAKIKFILIEPWMLKPPQKPPESPTDTRKPAQAPQTPKPAPNPPETQKPQECPVCGEEKENYGKWMCLNDDCTAYGT